MNRLFAKASMCKTAAVALFTTAALILTGCGLGTAAAPESSVIPALSGHAIGGNTPIAGATVKLYATGTAYGTGSFLQEANTAPGGTAGQDTDANGVFNFAGGYSCPAGQFAYVTLAGGNTGANTVNSNLVLVAALGRCEDIATHTFTDVNELSTIAAAYALGHFSSIVSGTGASTVVGIGAPAANNAVTGCVANGTTCTATVAAGLGHAFLNAANLVNVTNGVALASPPGNSTALVPQQLINSLGNVLVACVNSSGGSAPLGTTDGSACGNIFAATTLGGVTPVNTFSALVNLAANPTLGGSTAAVASFLGYATPATTIYSPALSAATGLNDLSIGIEYPKTVTTSATLCTGTCQALLFPQTGALDINDNYYVGNDSATGAAPTNVLSFSSAGSLNGITANNTTLKNALSLTLDALGNGFFANGTGSSTSDGGKFTYTSAGTASAAPATLAVGTGQNFSFAVDRANNVWVTSLSGLYMAPAGTTAFTAQGTGFTTFAAPSSRVVGLAIDPDQNVWTSPNTTLYVLPNSGTAAAPSYITSSTPNTFLTGTTIANTASAVVFVSGSPYTAYIPGYSTGANPGVQVYTPTVSSAAVTSLGAGALFTSTAITGSLGGAADGAGNIWLADSIGKSLTLYNPTAGTAYRYEPCVVTGGTSTTCTSSFGSAAKMFNVSVDSSGSIWVPDAGDGNIIQVIGAAAPTWPLLSLGKTGLVQ